MLSYLSLVFFGTLHSNGFMCPFLLCLFSFSFLSYLQGHLRQPFCLFAFLFLGDGLDHTSYTMSRTSVHSSLGTLPIRSNPLNLWTEVPDIVQETGIKTISKKKRCKKATWLSKEALQITVKRREAKSKGEKERYTHLNAEFQRIPRRDKKAFLSD